MPINWKSIWPRKRLTVVAATGNPQVLAALWRQPGVRVREARTAEGVNALLGEARLVICDGADLAHSSLDANYLAAALAQAQIPHTDSAGFLAEPARWLGQADAFAGHIRSLPPRLVVFTALASGGVGKTTLTLGLAAGGNFREAAVAANCAAGITVGEVGVATTTQAELKQRIAEEPWK